jgi:hypothetical protein
VRPFALIGGDGQRLSVKSLSEDRRFAFALAFAILCDPTRCVMPKEQNPVKSVRRYDWSALRRDSEPAGRDGGAGGRVSVGSAPDLGEAFTGSSTRSALTAM